MQSLEEIKATLIKAIKFGNQYIPLTLGGIENVIRSNNPRIGFNSDEIRVLSIRLAQYEAHRRMLAEFITTVTLKLENAPKDESEKKILMQELCQAIPKLQNYIHAAIKAHTKLNNITLRILDRSARFNKDHYLNHLSRVDSKEVFNNFYYFKFVLQKYEAAITALSQKMEHQRKSSITELDMKCLKEKMVEIELLGDMASNAYNEYDLTLTKEAWKFVLEEYEKDVPAPLLFSIKKKGTNAAMDKGNENSSHDNLNKENSNIPRLTEKKESAEIQQLSLSPRVDSFNNYDWLKDLISAYKQIFEQRYLEKNLNLDIPEEEYWPSCQLKAFIRHVLGNKHLYDIKIHRIVQCAIDKIGGYLDTLDDAFNDDPTKQYGLFKTDIAIEMLDDLQDFLFEKKQMIDKDIETAIALEKFRLWEKSLLSDSDVEEDEVEDEENDITPSVSLTPSP